jgi:RNA polymerase sigma factor (sigma-70 family)
LAEEVTQVVFILLARKAKSIRGGGVLPAWLHKTTRYTALNVLRRQTRQRNHEQKAAQMVSETYRVDSTWKWLSPVLDEGLARLNQNERAAVMLRFFGHKSLAETGDSLGISEQAAGMRVRRALEKLRMYFNRRGVSLTAVALGGVMSANCVRAAPPAMAHSAATNALRIVRGGAGTTTAVSIANAVARALFIDKAAAAAMFVASVLALGAFTSLFVNHVVWPAWQHESPQRQEQMLRVDPVSLEIWRNGMT